MQRQFLLFVWIAITISCQQKEDSSLTNYIDPFIGTDETDFVSLWRSEAGLYPGAVAPHGMVQLTPETQRRGEYLQGYFYKKDTIRKFSMTEHFSGWPNGSTGKGHFMPFVTNDYKNISSKALKSSFDHGREKAKAGYYQVDLIDHDIACEFAALVRSGIANFTFEKEGKKGVLFSSFKSFESIGENQYKAILNAGRSEFIKANQVIHVHLVFDKEVILEEVKSNRRTSWVIFPKDASVDQLQFKVGLSYTSFKNAKENLQSEIPGWVVAKVAKQSDQLWEQEMNRVELEGNEVDKKTFYTALYHASLLPVNATDVNRQYPGYENSAPLAEDETHYIYFTPWDAFRTMHPLINFINPKKGRDYITSSLRFYDTYQRIPEPSVMTSVFMSSLYADALEQGIDFDIQKAYQGLKELMIEKPYFRDVKMEAYDSLGYVPFPMSYATTATLEFAHNDWSLARMAEHLGEKELAEKLYDRSLNYQSQMEPKSRFVKSKNPDGSWADATIFAEADKWNMSWFAPHDNQGLINLMGGEEAFVAHLNQNFEEGHYTLDNECPMNFPWLFSYAGRPDLTMKWVNHTLRKFFKNKPYGVPGNDDWGTMSSVYMWGALGLFPAAPGSGELIMSGPLFSKAVIHRTDQETITITANNVSKDRIYIQNAALDNEKYDHVFVKMDELINHAISFEMGNQPNLSFGVKGEKPYSLTTESPSFEVKEVRLAHDEVKSNQPIEVLCKVKNHGAVGNFLLEIKDDHKTLHSEYFMIKGGQMKELNTSVRLYEGGSHPIAVGDIQNEVEVIPTKLSLKEALEIQKIMINPLIHVAEKAKWKVRVKNISGAEISFIPTLYLNDEKQSVQQEMNLTPGEEKEIEGVLSVDELAGFQEVHLNHGAKVKFKVYEKSEETLVVHYDFETKGKWVEDQSGFENHGVIYGDLNWIQGKEGQGIQINDGHIAIPRSKSTEIEGDELTMLAWYKPVDQKGTAPLITKGGFHMLKLNGKWQLKFAAGSWGRGQCFYNVKPKKDNMKQPQWLGEWTHFAGVKDASTIRVIVNGEEKNRLDHNGPIKNSEFEWRIGGNQEHPHGRVATGVLDEVRIYAGALSSSQVNAILSKN